ncbi:hypothetical protein NCLIV_029020 [Neospora caninum Liverpool]|uniref:Polypeptide N-acetylgalactosaminyltransferase, related n=1 Tax=Neospora caninum (strain Liverpool) TaxID=572307 RepID=F0VHB9_NEOCL|nr:hypothetical protein NCLIV_029020 [Neospora caninum Liverpool]CBZ53113.1 hypothetical protein NCLIV_029020 [Neospora caninum Liverpool]CEL67099.1 TPA: Polypeptide N-acetylgalactosaminyltransferase, related [Neospora caninum Liverpool]|eukprot:XP_003883145.1 hypothetical protein NCLIV_029020 [Neospora caninum Liverpool]
MSLVYGIAFRLAKYDLSLLPATSIIIAFYNEHPSVLYRTLHSILNRTPLQLLEEIILVDDGSTFPFTTDDKAPHALSKYLDTLPKVRLLRHQTRKGVTAARSAGIRAAKSRVFVVLDSHVEVGHQWFEPLVARVASNPETIVFPLVDAIDSRTLEFRNSGVGCSMGLIWSVMEHGFVPTSPERLAYSPGAYRPSPTMMGSVFAADKSYFLQHGGYDEGMRFGGAENIELSLRQWQCGGRLECSPCSRVFHLFRSAGDALPVPLYALLANKMRTMAAWMDEYADLACDSHTKATEDMALYTTTVFCPERPLLLRDNTFLCLDGGHPHPGGQTADITNACGRAGTLFMYFARSMQVKMARNDEACLKGNLAIAWCEENGPMMKNLGLGMN